MHFIKTITKGEITNSDCELNMFCSGYKQNDRVSNNKKSRGLINLLK